MKASPLLVQVYCGEEQAEEPGAGVGTAAQDAGCSVWAHIGLHFPARMSAKVALSSTISPTKQLSGKPPAQLLALLAAAYTDGDTWPLAPQV